MNISYNTLAANKATAKQVDKGIGGKDNPDYNYNPDGTSNGYDKNTSNGNGTGKLSKKGKVGQEKDKEKKKRKALAAGKARAFNSNINPYEVTLPDLMHGKVRM